MLPRSTPAPSWSIPPFPAEVQDRQELVTVDDAFLTSVRQGPLRTFERPNRWLRGAVHDERGRLLVASQKVGGLGGNQGVMADPACVRRSGRAERLSGTWLYGGHWIGHFGHFFTETMTTLWPDRSRLPEPPRGLVFHKYFGPHLGIAAWQQELLALTTYADLPLEVVTAKPRRVDRLLLPSRSVVVNGWAHAGARDVWQHMAAVAGPPDPGQRGARVFLSRRAFNAARGAAGRPVRTSPGRDEALDRVFTDLGFLVVTPEELPVRDQVRLVAGASVVAGSAGTALHLSAFAPAGTRVIELGDRRSPDVQVPQQQMIDHLCGHPTLFVPLSVQPAALRRLLRRALRTPG